MRRTFITLPDFSSLSPFSNSVPEAQTYHERKILPYVRSELYRVVADVSSYHKFIPFCTSSRILESSSPLQAHLTARDKPDVLEMDGELTVAFLALKESYVSKVTCKPYESVQAVALSSTPLFKNLTTTWRFQPASPQSPHMSMDGPTAQTQKISAGDEAGPTLLTLDLSYAFANPLHAAVSSAFFGQVSKLMVEAFEKRCLAVYGLGRK
ncbi:lipid transport protein [Heterobasidion irregulare TC 32-1]|uniref:Lipid transport protein n=1 Tax=Heterobasidion irregulare (strain TC 32-1) TaxID=747525 RepID=W4KE59_HETIT|nr:lipid transport protein [Heterobasidion irregulare TC 32-1]ETW83605.1 lipid transport protein [Heterobasidion irregulare TC 32-1]